MNNDQQQFTKYPKNISAWRRHLASNEWNVLSIIHEKTAGWDKTSDAVSISQIMAETTMSRSNIQRALASMQSEDGPLEVISRGHRGIAVYRIRPCDCSTGGTVETIDQPAGGTVPPDQPAGGTVDTTSDPPAVPSVTETDPPVTTTTDVITAKEERVFKTLSIESEQGAAIQNSTPTSKTVEVNGSIEETEGKVNPAPVALGPPTSQVLFVNPKTGKTWEIGQDLSCLSYSLKITMGEAKAILEDGNGMGVATILEILKKNWKRESGKDIRSATNKAAYMRTIIQNQAPGRKANTPATATKQTSPHTRAPLPIQAPAATGVQSRTDAMVRDAIHAMGNGKYTVEEIGAEVTKERGKYDKLTLQTYLAGMTRRGLVHFDQGADGVVRYFSLEAPGKPVAPARAAEPTQEAA